MYKIFLRNIVLIFCIQILCLLRSLQSESRSKFDSLGTLKFSSRHNFVLLKLRNLRLSSLYPNALCNSWEQQCRDQKMCSSHPAKVHLQAKCWPRSVNQPHANIHLCFHELTSFYVLAPPEKGIHATYGLEYKMLPFGGAMICQVDAHICFMPSKQVEHGLLKFSVCTNWNGVNPYQKYMALRLSFPFCRNRHGWDIGCFLRLMITWG